MSMKKAEFLDNFILLSISNFQLSRVYYEKFITSVSGLEDGQMTSDTQRAPEDAIIN